MGLKQDVANALGETSSASPSTKPEPKPVTVSPEAVLALSKKVREWSGWSDATLVFGQPTVSPHADVDHVTHIFTVKGENVILNPHRVLSTITPFRLRQEAVLTGCLLHEAGHARHSHWLPRTKEQAERKPARHSDGAEPTKATIKFARLMEEPRVEGLQARDADKIGATGLGWTMRASAAHLTPTTVLNTTSPEQKVMDMITSWALRAGRQIGLNHHTKTHPLRNWVQDFTTLLHAVILNHLAAVDSPDPSVDAKHVMDLLLEMIRCTDDDGSTMIDFARDVLALLFPETEDEDMPEPGSGCGSESGSESGEEEQDSEGAEAGAAGGESDDEDSDGGQGQTPDEDAESGPEEGSDGSDEGEDSEDGRGFGEFGDQTLEEALAEMEEKAKSEVTEESSEEVTKTPPMSGGGSGGSGEGSMSGGFRHPTKDERDIQKGAEKFLRDLISPNESSTVSLTDSPSATVDAAALAAWKADGGTRDPRFFIRTRRDVQPSPPVKVAILVDVSSSMEELQKPSAILSWALASAALDLRNFAGRGQQLESTLIHWGNSARVVQKNGQTLPGIREVPCMEGTHAMSAALDLVEQELPGFFDIGERPEHRLLVQFTDWQLFGAKPPQIAKALAAGVNMVSIVPTDFRSQYTNLPAILKGCTIQRGTSTVLNYNRKSPSAVWDAAAEALV